MKLQHYMELEYMIHMIMKIDRQLKNKEKGAFLSLAQDGQGRRKRRELK